MIVRAPGWRNQDVRSPLLHDMTKTQYGRSERFAEERRPKIYLGKCFLREPTELEPLVTFDSRVRNRLVQELGPWREASKKIQSDLVIRNIGVHEEVLDDINQFHAFNGFVQLLRHLAHDRALCGFSRLDSTARQCPVRIAFHPVQQYMAVVNDNRRRAQLKSMPCNVDRYHLCTLMFDVKEIPQSCWCAP